MPQSRLGRAGTLELRYCFFRGCMRAARMTADCTSLVMLASPLWPSTLREAGERRALSSTIGPPLGLGPIFRNHIMSLLDTVLNAGSAALGRNNTAENGLLPVLVDLLSPNGEIGGLSGLATRFENAGLGTIVQSWISEHAANLPISGEQLQQILGSELLQNIAARVGIDIAQLLPLLSQFLPITVDQLTPQGELPQGKGGLGDLIGLFGNVLKS
jgi:uncharacterized protein YidB (DUF937 family)